MWNKVPKKVSVYTACFLNILTKPQRKHFLVYIIGLICLIKFRSISEIANKYSGGRKDGLHHFIKNSVKKTDELEKTNQELIAKSIEDGEIIMAIDDTPCPRKGEKIEGIGVHHGADGFVKGLCAVTAIIKTSTQQFAWAIKGYYSKKSCPDNFKSKVHLASEIIDETKKYISKPLIVLMDAWYTCVPILGKIIEAKWIFVAAIKRNRKIIVAGRKTRVRHLAKGRTKYEIVRLSRKKCFKVAKQIVYLPKVGDVLLFICKYKNKTTFYISNNLKLSIRKMVKLYSKRFMIEFFHKDIKQHLGFREIFVRSRHSVQKHWTLIAIAYNIIVLSDNGKHKSFRQKIFHFRNSFSNDSLMILPNMLKITV
ncbi:MAG: transposase [Candidatus Firestonebacteria bacterium]|nr:transposase [Candidatus Firestonebacteria bacterium]